MFKSVEPNIIVFDNALHREEVVKLWQQVFGYETAHNEPNLVIDQKLAVNDDLFFVALKDERVIGSIMAGYDGHRGWLYAVAVAPNLRYQSIGSQLVSHAEKVLIQKGCLKINLQILQDNEAVKVFYASLGYEVEARVSMGKRM